MRIGDFSASAAVSASEIDFNAEIAEDAAKKNNLFEDAATEDIFAQIADRILQRFLRIAGVKPSSSSAFDESKYQKYSACSTSFGITGDGLPQFLNTELIMLEPAIASFFGTLSIGADTPESRSSRPKNCSNVIFAAPSRYFS